MNKKQIRKKANEFLEDYLENTDWEHSQSSTEVQTDAIARVSQDNILYFEVDYSLWDDVKGSTKIKFQINENNTFTDIEETLLENEQPKNFDCLNKVLTKMSEYLSSEIQQFVDDNETDIGELMRESGGDGYICDGLYWN